MNFQLPEKNIVPVRHNHSISARIPVKSHCEGFVERLQTAM